MSATYRIVHFMPQPFHGGRVPIAAIVEERGRVSLARASLLPEDAALGVVGGRATISLILRGLESAGVHGAFSGILGPHAVLDSVRRIPEGVRDAVAWVIETTLPRAMGPIREGAPRPGRQQEGYRLFESLDVARHVERRFTPERLWRGLSRDGAPDDLVRLKPIAHYVDGGNLLLMEPILPARTGHEATLTEVGTNFRAWRYEQEHRPPPRSARLVAYVLPGGHKDARRSAFRAMAQIADDVFDASAAPDRTRLALMIRQAAAQPPLPLTRQ